MKPLLASTDSSIILARSTLKADAVAGSSVTLQLVNNAGFADAAFVVIGELGSELAELQQINQAVTAGSNIRVATLVRDHPEGTPVVVFRYNKRKFYGSETQGGTYTELSGSPIAIGVDNPQGTYMEYTGSTYNYFKATYYNSTTVEETDKDDLTGQAADQSTRYCTIWDIRLQAGLTQNPYISDGRLERKRLQAENLVNSYIGNKYVLPLTYVPGMVQIITTLLAAGYVDFEEYGADGLGVKWLGEAKGMLKAIQEGSQTLFDADQIQLPTLTDGGGFAMEGKPDTDGSDSSGEDSPAMFRKDMKF